MDAKHLKNEKVLETNVGLTNDKVNYLLARILKPFRGATVILKNNTYENFHLSRDLGQVPLGLSELWFPHCKTGLMPPT